MARANNARDARSEPSVIYPNGGSNNRSTTIHSDSTNDIVVQLVQLIGRSIETQEPLPIDAVDGAVSTIRGLYNVPGTHYIYMVRDGDVSTCPEFVPGSQGKVKKIVTFPSNVEETTIIRATVFTYQNPTFPTKVTTITDYEEAASFYMTAGELSYDVNSTAQNSITPN